MAAEANRKIQLRTRNQRSMSCCYSGLCGKKLIVLPRISEYPLSCWRCMIVDAVSETASQCLLEEDDEEK
jgi:hypothetical protein